MNRDDVQTWLDRYVAAWLSYDPIAIGDLFSEDVIYRFHPWHEDDLVVRGRAAVVTAWLEPELHDDPATIEARYRPYAVEGDRAVAVGSSRYLAAPGGSLREAYENCFLLRFAGDGRCAEFTEFWVKRPEAAHPGTTR
ncbi:MAG: hypothetical protein QOF11_2191 [Chloroflexota bacterium]|jgi:ketosteroid isomerase-like protein|nr:hypothetical protein [Chloroflexota bacterium]